MELCFQNNKTCIYSTTDYEKLRREYRIVGEFLGASQATPFTLLPEEALLLLDKNVANLMQFPKLQEEPTSLNQEEYNKLQSELMVAEQIIYKDYRKKDLEPYLDKIVKAKRLKVKDDCVSHTSVLDEELRKVEVTPNNIIWPILNEAPDTITGDGKKVQTSVLMKQTTPTRLQVFTDLWEKGYYITCGRKFGGDFLVYAGDPTAFHAVYIVRCVEDPSQELHASELIAFGRLGTSVKKKSVLASLINKTINYITVNWLD
ncbi:hypothetical protein FQA39_LY11471 [Lamprigera yunnana]|nr:hypothetical protein FQA39_LY11471 [Lamprigera yunnana]